MAEIVWNDVSGSLCMIIEKYDEHLQSISNELDVPLYKRFSEEWVAKFLKLDLQILQKLRNHREIGFLSLPGTNVEYFGVHVLEYLLSIDTGSKKNKGVVEDIILRMSEVSQIAGLSRTTIWRYEKAGRFPERIPLGGGSVGWYKSEIDNWVVSRRQKNYSARRDLNGQSTLSIKQKSRIHLLTATRN